MKHLNGIVCRITWKRQISLLSSMLIKIGILSCVYIYFFGFSIPNFIYVYLFLFLFLFDFLPTILLHTQYLIRSSNYIIIIDRKNRTIEYKSKINAKRNFDDILLLEYVASYGGGTGWYSFGEYRYYKIIFKDKSSLIINCLMLKDIKHNVEPLFGKKANARLKILPFI